MSLAHLNPAETAMRDALYSSLSSVVLEYEARAEAVHESQLLFSNQLDMLQRELDALAELAALPSLERHVRLLGDAKRRLVAVNATMAIIAERLRRVSSTIAAKRASSPAL